MKRTISAVEARKRFGELLESVYHGDDEVVIQRAGKPMAVVVPMAVYESWEENRRELFRMIREVQQLNKDVPYEVIEQEVNDAVKEVRGTRRAKRSITSSVTPD